MFLLIRHLDRPLNKCLWVWGRECFFKNCKEERSERMGCCHTAGCWKKAWITRKCVIYGLTACINHPVLFVHFSFLSSPSLSPSHCIKQNDNVDSTQLYIQNTIMRGEEFLFYDLFQERGGRRRSNPTCGDLVSSSLRWLSFASQAAGPHARLRQSPLNRRQNHHLLLF